MSELKPCNILENAHFPYYGMTCELGAKCPNRATSRAEAEMREELEILVTVLNAMELRDSAKQVAAILAKYPKGGAT